MAKFLCLLFVQAVGLDRNRQMAVPDNIHLAGWFSRSAKPGQPGLSIINGHVDGQHTFGIFGHLEQLKPGDQFSVELGDTATRVYQVKSVQSIAVADAANQLFSQDPRIASQLNLITCGGTFNLTTQRYDHRIIVVAELL